MWWNFLSLDPAKKHAHRTISPLQGFVAGGGGTIEKTSLPAADSGVTSRNIGTMKNANAILYHPQGVNK
jgi:hypothetical protein